MEHLNLSGIRIKVRIKILVTVRREIIELLLNHGIGEEQA